MTSETVQLSGYISGKPETLLIPLICCRYFRQVLSLIPEIPVFNTILSFGHTGKILVFRI